MGKFGLAKALAKAYRSGGRSKVKKVVKGRATAKEASRQAGEQMGSDYSKSEIAEMLRAGSARVHPIKRGLKTRGRERLLSPAERSRRLRGSKLRAEKEWRDRQRGR